MNQLCRLTKRIIVGCEGRWAGEGGQGYRSYQHGSTSCSASLSDPGWGCARGGTAKGQDLLRGRGPRAVPLNDYKRGATTIIYFREPCTPCRSYIRGTEGSWISCAPDGSRRRATRGAAPQRGSDLQRQGKPVDCRQMWRGLVPGAERRGGQGLPAPILASLIPHVPDPRPVRGADPGAGTGATMVSCAVTVFTVCWWWWWWWWWVVVVPWCDPGAGGRGGAGQGRTDVGWAETA